jgi:hypothetical protein
MLHLHCINSWLIFCTEIITVYFKNQTKPVSSLYGKSKELHSVKRLVSTITALLQRIKIGDDRSHPNIYPLAIRDHVTVPLDALYHLQ